MSNNLGCEFDISRLSAVTINAQCVYDAEQEIINQCHKFKGLYRVAWLLKAVSCLDLTTLSGDDTWGNVTRLIHKALNPLSEDILAVFGSPIKPLTTAAVCVYPSRVKDAVTAIGNAPLPVAAVGCGFPSGQYSLYTGFREIKCCVENGAREIDVVIDRSLVLRSQWEALYDDLKLMKEKCEGVKMKTILSVGELGSLRNVYKASLVAMMAGSDFLKTSTGKETVNATYPVGLVMMRAIRDYYLETSYKVGFKAAGGIKTANDALNWLALAKKELGRKWLDKSLFRIGASGLLKDLEEELHVLAFNRQPSPWEVTLR